MTDEIQPLDLNDSPAPRPDDMDADADLARPSRVLQYRTQRQAQFSMAIPALLLVMIGAIYLVNIFAPDLDLLTPSLAVGIGVFALGLALLGRYLANGRRERGLLFMALLIFLWLGLATLISFDVIRLSQGWPLALSAIGIAMIGILLFGRNRDRGLLLPGLAIIVAGVAALPFTMNLLPSAWLPYIAAYWPILLIILAILLLPGVLRKRTA